LYYETVISREGWQQVIAIKTIIGQLFFLNQNFFFLFLTGFPETNRQKAGGHYITYENKSTFPVLADKPFWLCDSPTGKVTAN